MSSDPLAALKTHREWLAGLRLVDKAELVAVAVVGAHLLVCIGVLAWLGAWVVLVEVLAVHLVFIAAGVLTARRSMSIGVQGAVALSLMFTMVVALSDPSMLREIGHGYALLGLLALLMAVWGLVVHGRSWRGIGKYTKQDDFKWLVTRAPLSLRYMVQWHVRRLG